MDLSVAIARKLESIAGYLSCPGALSARLRWRRFNWSIFETVRYLRNLNSKFDAIIDVGASEGIFAIAALEAFPCARVLAFEPLKEHRAQLESLASGRGQGRLTVWPVALGSHKGVLSFSISGHLPSSSFLRMSNQHSTEYPGSQVVANRRVKVDSLDAVLDARELGKEMLLKLDVQGYELEVLRGAQQTLKGVDAIVVEISLARLYELAPTFRDIDSFMADAGFEFVGPVAAGKGRITQRSLQMDALYAKTAGATWSAAVGLAADARGAG